MEIINEIEYVKGDHIINNAPIYSKSCRNARDLIRKKNIPAENYIYAKLNENKWIVSNGLSIKYDKIFILKKYADTIPELKINVDEIIKNDDGIEKAPEIIILSDEEKFKDNDGNIMDIEVRGIREVDKIYFKVKDAEIIFDMKNLQHTLVDNNLSYESEIHYKFFMCEKSFKKSELTNKEKIKKTLFLTYEGLMRVLFVSKNNKTSKFIKWAVNKLFTIHLGTDEQKNKLISKIKGIEYSKIQEFFSLTPHNISCIYLSSLNDVKTLREKMNIDMKYPDSSIIYKFGLTENLERRKNEHRQNFKNIENLIDIKLVQYSLIDKEFLTRAEKDVKNEFSENIIEYEKMTELIILSNDELKKLKKMYADLSIKYSGSNQNLHDEIKQLKKDIITKDEKYTNEILQLKKDKNYEYEIFIKNHEIEMLKKTHEIEMLKLELNFYKNK